ADYVPGDAKPVDFDGKIAELGRFALGAILEKAVSDADSGAPDARRRRVKQLCFFQYRDGAPMATVGWMIVAGDELTVYESSHFDALPFVTSGQTPFRIKIPNVTPLEVREMER